MERVAFLIEKTGERIGCMLNPESLISRRSAGIVRRSGTSGLLQAPRQTDDLLLYVGGGSTEMVLDLLFDTTLAGDMPAAGNDNLTSDVRDLTRPLWNLAENHADDQGQAELPIVRLLWGKCLNMPGLVTAVAERLEFFDEAGIPRRSWLRLKFCRVNVAEPSAASTPPISDLENLLGPTPGDSGISRAAVELTGGIHPEPETDATPSRLDEVAFSTYGDPGLWRLIAWFNGVSDPLHVTAGTLLQIPQIPALSSATTSTEKSQ